MDVVLVPGLWLDSSVWAEVATELARLGHRPVSVRLPGADDEVDATLDDQVDAVLAAVDAATDPVLVGHSAASALVWICADRRPTAVALVVMVGGFPRSDGAAYAPFFPVVDGRMPFPGWEPFEGPDCADLDDATRRRIAAAAHPVPEGVACGVVRLGDPARFDVPVVVVCPEFSPEQARAWVAQGEVPELAASAQVGYVDIDAGHWPMVSAPGELARVLDGVARGA